MNLLFTYVVQSYLYNIVWGYPLSPSPRVQRNSGFFNSKFKSSFDRKPNQITPLRIRIQSHLRERRQFVAETATVRRQSPKTATAAEFGDSHILLDCINLQDIRRRQFSVTCLRDLFETIDNRVVIDFIKDMVSVFSFYLNLLLHFIAFVQFVVTYLAIFSISST